MSWVRHELSYDSLQKNGDRIYQLSIKFPNGILDPNTPYAIAPMLADRYPEIESYTPVRRLSMLSNYSFKFFPDSDDQVKVYESEVVKVNENFFDIFDFDLLYGNRDILLDRPQSVVISSRIAQTYFKGNNPVGQSIIMNNESLLTITGVIDIPSNSSFSYDFFLVNTSNLTVDWNWRDPSFVLLHPGVDIESFELKISSFFNDNHPYDFKEQFVLQILPVKKAHLTFSGTQRVIIFTCIAFLLLLTAALNYMNLASANYLNRTKEAGMRKVSGADNWSLRRIIYIETYILATFATMISLFLAEIIIPFLEPLTGKSFEIGYLDNPLLLLYIFIVVAITLSLSSLYPSSIFLRGQPINSDKKQHLNGKKSPIFILLTVILQFTLTITLLISAFVIKSQINYSLKKELGFSVENVISIPMNRAIGDNLLVFIERLESYQSIEEVTLGQSLPYNEDIKTNINWIHNSNQQSESFRYSICLNNYPDLFSMRLIQGRYFNDQIGLDAEKYLINETAARLLGYDNPVGEYFNMWGVEGEIIGVVEDFHHVSLHREIMPHIFNVNPRNYNALKNIFVKLTGQNKQDAILQIEKTCDEFAADFPFEYLSLEDDIGQLYRNDRNLASIIGVFVILTIGLSILGIYGLAYHSVEKKTREITIRRVFGASLKNNLILIYKRLMTQVGISFVIAVALSMYLMTNWLSNFAYRTELRPSQFILALIVALFTAILTITIAMWKTVNKNPSENLKQQ